MVYARRWVAAAVVVLAAGLGGCTSAAGPPKTAAGERAPKPLEIADADFAASLHDVLLDGARTEARHAKLLGVVRAQLRHARERFERGADDRGLKSVLGAMYLLRPGEGSTELVDAETARSLDGAIRRLSARGDDGRARVLMVLRVAASTGAERKDLEAQIAALDRFALETRTGKPMEQLGDAQRAAMGRAILDPRGIDEAVRATSDWIDLAIEHNIAFRQTGKRPSPEEGIEIARGLGTGGVAVVALMLRHGDAVGAIEKVDASSAKRVIDPDLYAQLQQAVARDDALSYRGVYAALHAHTQDRVGGEIGIDADLLEAAFFAVALEAYRREPTHLPTAVDLGRALAALGMSEAVPLVLAQPLASDPRPSDVAVALRTLSLAVDADAAVNDFAGARRTIAASKDLLAKSKKVVGAAKSTPSVADVRFRMAAVLVRGGALEPARALIAEALPDQPTPEAHLLLAMVERQSGRLPEALDAATKAASAATVTPLDAADAHLIAFEIHRDAGRSADAQASLTKALEATTKALDGGPAPPVKVRALRTLGRVLHAYGDAPGSRKAFARALDSVSGDGALLGSTMLQAASAALVRRDLEAARAALRKGIEAGAPQEDLVYGALWLMLVERQLGATPDGTVAEILDAAMGAPTWVGKLAAWAKGRLTDDALLGQAFSEATRVEATFYVAMAKRAGGTQSDDSLRKVAESPVLDLMEVQIARDLLAPRTTFALPKGVKIP